MQLFICSISKGASFFINVIYWQMEPALRCPPSIKFVKTKNRMRKDKLHDEARTLLHQEPSDPAQQRVREASFSPGASTAESTSRISEFINLAHKRRPQIVWSNQKALGQYSGMDTFFSKREILLISSGYIKMIHRLEIFPASVLRAHSLLQK